MTGSTRELSLSHGWLRICLCVAPLIGFAAGTAAEEAEPDDSPSDREPAIVERVRVAPSGSDGLGVSGSAAEIGNRELQRQEYSDIGRVLSAVPGANVQDEEGYGLRPNVGFRGSGSERSSKITLLEDGVLIAPAPYTAPAAYYFPTIGRMEGVEVRLGSSSIRQGPFTTGGVLNLISSSIPSEFAGDARVSGGTNGTLRGGVRAGGAGARLGWLVETYRFETDGFKRLDGGGSTGVELDDFLVKFRVSSDPGDPVYSQLELKFGKTVQFGHETYLGLDQGDFDRTPYRRYAGSQQDTLDSDHRQIQVRYLVRPGARTDLVVTAYRNEFSRNWRKLGKVGGVSIADVFDDPTAYSAELSVLRGDEDSAPDALNVRNNRRDYYSQGLQLVGGVHAGGGAARHDVEVGLRFHQDEEDRFQEEDLFEMVDGRMALTGTGDPGSQSNRVGDATAWAAHVQDSIRFDRWVLTPGVRLERIEYEQRDYGRDDPDRTGENLTRRSTVVQEWIPGIGATVRLGRDGELFAGVHRGFAPPGPAADGRSEPERSVNYELGYRQAGRLWNLQSAVFLHDYSNLLGADTLSSGGSGSGDTFNAGAARTYGFECTAASDLGRARGLGIGIPVQLTYAYTNAEFLTSFDPDFDGWGAVVAGDELPYVAPHQAAISAGITGSRWSGFANVIYRDRMRTTPGQGASAVEESTGRAVLVDVSSTYRFDSGLRLFARIRNLTDEVYVAARRPAGARPGLSRTSLVGLGFDW